MVVKVHINTLLDIMIMIAQKMKFSIRDSSVNVAKSAEICGFGHF